MGMGYRSPPTQEHGRTTPTPHHTAPPLAASLKTPHTTQKPSGHHQPQPKPQLGTKPQAKATALEQPHTATTPNRALPQEPTRDPTPAATQAPDTDMAYSPHHKAARQHASIHDDAMALDVHSLLELEFQDTEDAERHRDQTPLGVEPMAIDPADHDRADSPQSAPLRPPSRVRAPLVQLSNARRRHHPTHEASKGPIEYRAFLERYLPEITGSLLHGYTTTPPQGNRTQELEEEYAVNVTDMMAYMESVQDPEQDIIPSLLAYHSWRWGLQATLHRPKSEPHQCSPEQTARWSIILQITAEGSYILTHSGLPDAVPNAQAPPLTQPQEDDTGAPPSEDCNWDPPRPPLITCRIDSPSVTSPTTTMPQMTRGDAARCLCCGHCPKAPSGT